MKKIIISNLCIFACSVSMAHAQDGQWYAGLDGAYSILGKEQSNGSLLNLNNHFNDGVAVGGSVGYDFGKFRLEGEFGKHFHSADRFNIINDGGLGLGGTGNQNAASGKSNATHLMLNAIMDFDGLIGDSKIEPFIGGGLGITDVKWSNLATTSAGISSASDTVFGYQMFAGLRAPISESVELSLKYRYMGTNDSSMTDRIGNVFKASYDVHDIVIGLVYRFGKKNNSVTDRMPQPIAVAKPAPAPVAEVKPVVVVPKPAPKPKPVVINKGPHSIYFGWDSIEIDKAARMAINDVVIETKKAKEVTVMVDGYTDRSGSNKYNANLSLKRAEVVKNELIRLGVDANSIFIGSHGENVNETTTADGIKERKNRRVVITSK